MVGDVVRVLDADDPRRVVARSSEEGDVGADVQKLVQQTQLPEGMRFDVGGATKEQQEAFGAMLGAMALAIIFIYIV